jgi:hypothetical protein
MPKSRWEDGQVLADGPSASTSVWEPSNTDLSPQGEPGEAGDPGLPGEGGPLVSVTLEEE